MGALGFCKLQAKKMWGNFPRQNWDVKTLTCSVLTILIFPQSIHRRVRTKQKGRKSKVKKIIATLAS